MKKIVSVLLAFMSFVCVANAQLYVDGDVNKDGKVSLADLPKLIDMINGSESARTPESLLAGKWQTRDEEVMNLNEDGTTDYEGSATFKYYAKEKNLYMYDSEGDVVHLFKVENICTAYMVLKELGQQDSKIYYNEFLIANPVIKEVHDTVIVTKPYEPSVGDEFAAVDLGLPSGKLWANMNLYANSPEEVGYYYAWGEEIRKVSYTSNNWVGKNFVDVAAKTLGEGWRMPTKEEFQELINYCVCTDDELNGIKGKRYTGLNGNSIFFPNNGRIDNAKTILSDKCIYVSSTLNGTNRIYCLVDNNIYTGFNISNTSYYNDRYNGYNIRPIYIPSTQQ